MLLTRLIIVIKLFSLKGFFWVLIFEGIIHFFLFPNEKVNYIVVEDENKIMDWQGHLSNNLHFSTTS